MIKRYSFKDETFNGAGDARMTEEKNGNFVTYEDHLAAMPKWISVEDRLPNDGDLIAIKDQIDYEAGVVKNKYGDLWWRFSFDPTHWMPLPQPSEDSI